MKVGQLSSKASSSKGAPPKGLSSKGAPPPKGLSSKQPPPKGLSSKGAPQKGRSFTACISLTDTQLSLLNVVRSKMSPLDWNNLWTVILNDKTGVVLKVLAEKEYSETEADDLADINDHLCAVVQKLEGKQIKYD